MIHMVDTFIDTVQGAKTSFVNTFVYNEELKKPLQTYINAQTTFAKKVAQESFSFFTTVGIAANAFDVKKAFSVK
jgi:hypothetical protein